MTSPSTALEPPPSRAESTGRGTADRKTFRIAALLVLAGVALHARSVQWGFFYDDYVHQLVLQRGVPESGMRPWNLYNFGTFPAPDTKLFQSGAFPWWTSPDFKMSFFRPVTSLSIWLDHTIYGSWPPGYHVTSLLIFAVLLILAYRLFCRLGAPPRAALWALAFFALEDCHHLPIGWIANRNTLLSASFVIATLLCYDRYRRGGTFGWLLGAILCFLLGCGSKESGLMALPLLGLYHIVLVRRTTSHTFARTCLDTLRTPALYPFVAIAVAFVGFYVANGYGARSAMYTVAWVDPLAYLGKLVVLIPVGFASLLAGMVTDLLPAMPELLWPMVGASLVILVLPTTMLWRVLRNEPLALFALGWTVVCILPEGAAEYSDRLLTGAAVGTSLLIGLFLDRVGPLRQLVRDRKLFRVAATVGFLFAGLVLSPLLISSRADAIIDLAAKDIEMTRTAEIDAHATPPQRVFVLNGHSPLAQLNLPITWSVMYNDPDTYIYPFQLARRPLIWTRLGENAMTLTSDAEPFISTRFETLFRTEISGPPKGKRYPTAEFDAIAEEVTPTGIRTVRFQFKSNLDDPSYRFLAWRDGQLKRIDPPAVGKTIHVAAVKRSHPFAP